MTQPILPALAGIAQAHADARQPGATFEAIDRAAAATIGHKLFTVLAYYPGAHESQRIYTNMPEAYPVGGRKPVTDAPWMQQVVQRGESYIGRDAKDIRDVFFDHELIESLGCRSVLNVPVRWRGQTLGTLNLLHEAGWYRPEHVALGQVLAQLALPALIAP
jgi:hypothetical protein